MKAGVADTDGRRTAHLPDGGRSGIVRDQAQFLYHFPVYWFRPINERPAALLAAFACNLWIWTRSGATFRISRVTAMRVYRLGLLHIADRKLIRSTPDQRILSLNEGSVSNAT